MNESRSTSSATAGATSLPFDSARLDDLLDEAGIDAVVISSKHNIQYLFGGYRFFFFDHFDAIGVSFDRAGRVVDYEHLEGAF